MSTQNENSSGSFWQKVIDFLADDPIYVENKTDPVIEGWRVAYNDQKHRADVAEKRLTMIRELAEAYRKDSPQVSLDFRTLLDMSEEDLYTEYEDDEHT